MSQHLQEPIDPNVRLDIDGGNGGIGGGADGIPCTNCSTVNPTQARFCPSCGQPLQPIERISTGPLRESSPFSAYDAAASTAILFPSPATEEALPIAGNQEAMSSIPPVSSADTGGAIPLITNGFGRNNQGGWRRRIRSRRSITIALIALILLLVLISLPFLLPYLHTILPASTATVTITPASKNVSNTYTISAVTGTPDASQHQVGARLLSYTTPSKSVTVNATGQGTEGVTEATGTLIFSNSTGNFTIFAQTFADNSGIGLVIDSAFNISPGQTIAIFAHAARVGTIGNIPVDDINATFNAISGIGSVHIENTSPFTGGTDRTYSLVQQSDIDAAANGLESQLTSNAQSAVQNQVRANEQLVNDIQCNPKITSNHQANDRASDVTVTVSEKCQGEVYDLQAAQSMATDSLKSDAASQLGASYALVGNVVTGAPTIVSTDQRGTVSMNVDAHGLWVFQFSNDQKQNMAKLIAGKTQADAPALLLKQPGVIKVSINPSGGLGTALPSADNIKLVVLSLQ